MLYESGWTDELMRPIEHTQLPARARCGLTNLVDRVTASESELSIDEKRDSVPALVRKIAQHKPRFLCFVGKVRAECIARESLTRSGHRRRIRVRPEAAHGPALPRDDDGPAVHQTRARRPLGHVRLRDAEQLGHRTRQMAGVCGAVGPR